MLLKLTRDELIAQGLRPQQADDLLNALNQQIQHSSSLEQAWQAISQQMLSIKTIPLPIHAIIFSALFPNWQEHPELFAAWRPTKEIVCNANISKLMAELDIHEVRAFHQWTTKHVAAFWQNMLTKLHIIFKHEPSEICDLTHGVAAPTWFPDATMNIADSCFTADPTMPAIVYYDNKKDLQVMSYEELNRLSNRIANSLLQQGFVAGDAIGITMPMNQFAVAIYLGIIKMGGVVVSIPDSFTSQEIAKRHRMAKAKAIFTQDFSMWTGKKLPIYEKVGNSNIPMVIVLPLSDQLTVTLREQDHSWNDFLVADDQFVTAHCAPMAAANILFSSGTTGEPKAIVWNHTTPIKAASDAYFHQNIQAGDVLAWPTNLGWMMGPWLIYAALINHATIALYPGAPKDRSFGEFVAQAKVTMLGVVPTAVASWRLSRCMEGLDWSAVKLFTSTGECSNPDDMFYLMSLGGHKPIIEYCGGTEVGGSYVSSTIVENNYLSVFTTPAMGLDFTILDEDGQVANAGEVAIIPPSIGLSTALLNLDHYETYFANMPRSEDGKMLRRHGDQIRQYANGYYSVLGRVDDTMNLGGIKVSAAEIERALAALPEIIEVAAVAAVPPHNGPSLLIIYAATKVQLNKLTVMKDMQTKINAHLNPLFKIHDVIFVSELPKTASNKIMRRVLRKEYVMNEK